MAASRSSRLPAGHRRRALPRHSSIPSATTGSLTTTLAGAACRPSSHNPSNTGLLVSRHGCRCGMHHNLLLNEEQKQQVRSSTARCALCWRPRGQALHGDDPTMAGLAREQPASSAFHSKTIRCSHPILSTLCAARQHLPGGPLNN
eukprot:6203225-Pleurochrysis_carterae.AAC.2